MATVSEKYPGVDSQTRWIHDNYDLLETFPVHISAISESYIRHGWCYTHEISKYNVIEIPLDDAMTVETRDGIIEVAPGFGFFLPALEYNQLHYKGKGTLRKIAVSFYGVLAHPMMMAMFGSRRLLRLNSREFVLEYFGEIRNLFENQSPDHLPRLIGKSMEFLTAIVCRQGLEPQDSRLILANELIYGELLNKVHIRHLADLLRTSPYHLKQLFVNELNTTPGKYIKMRKLEFAKRLLSSNMLIQEVAVQLGYSSAFAFSHAFKNQTGLSPRKWRQKNAANKSDFGLKENDSEVILYERHFQRSN